MIIYISWLNYMRSRGFRENEVFTSMRNEKLGLSFKPQKKGPKKPGTTS